MTLFLTIVWLKLGVDTVQLQLPGLIKSSEFLGQDNSEKPLFERHFEATERARKPEGKISLFHKSGI